MVSERVDLYSYIGRCIILLSLSRDNVKQETTHINVEWQHEGLDKQIGGIDADIFYCRIRIRG